MSAIQELRVKEREARREIILSAAQQLFATRDLRKVTVREIAKTAGVASGTIYRYYKNLDELFVDIFLIHADGISTAIETERLKEKKCSIQRFCEIHVNYLNDNMAFYQMMSHFMLSDDLPSESSEKINPIMRRLMDLLERIIKESGFKEDSRLAAHALFASLNGTMISYAKYPGRSLEEVKRHTLRLALLIGQQFETR